MQGEKLTASRREQLSKIISTLTPSIRKAYERTPVDTLSDEEFETLKGEISNTPTTACCFSMLIE